MPLLSFVEFLAAAEECSDLKRRSKVAAHRGRMFARILISSKLRCLQRLGWSDDEVIGRGRRPSIAKPICHMQPRILAACMLGRRKQPDERFRKQSDVCRLLLLLRKLDVCFVYGALS